MKKILSLVLAFMMLFSVVLTASAEVSLSKYVFKGLGLDPNDDTVYTYTFGKFTGDPDEVGVKVNKDYKLSDEALTKAKANGGVFGIGLADTNNVLEGLTYSVIPYTITAGEREEGGRRTLSKTMGEPFENGDVTNLFINLYGSSNTSASNLTGSYATTMRKDTVMKPQWDVDAEGNPINTVIGTDFMNNKATILGIDKNNGYGQYALVFDCPDALIGAHPVNVDRSKGMWYNTGKTHYTVQLTLKKSAWVYVGHTGYSSMPTINNYALGYLKTQSNHQLTWSAMTGSVSPTSYASDASCYSMHAFYCYVPDGETRTFTTPVAGMRSYTGPVVFIKPENLDLTQYGEEWKATTLLTSTDASTPANVTNITLTGPAGSSGVSDDPETADVDESKIVLSDVGYQSRLLDDMVFDKDENGNDIPTVFGDSIYSKANRLFPTSGNYFFYVKVPEEMKGAKVVNVTRNPFGSSYNTTYDIELTVDKTSTLYVAASNDKAKGYTAYNPTPVSDALRYYQASGYTDATTSKLDPAGSYKGVNVYKLTLPVAEGAGPKTFKFNFSSWKYGGPLVFVK